VSPDVYYNAAFFYDSTGQWRPYPVYGKHYLVPVVERSRSFPFACSRACLDCGGGRAASPGSTLPVYETRIGRFGVVICYESVFGGPDSPLPERRGGFLREYHQRRVVRSHGRSVPARGASGHARHRNRMGIARAANDGISEFLDPWGTRTRRPAWSRKRWWADRASHQRRDSLYVRLGDWGGRCACSLPWDSPAGWRCRIGNEALEKRSVECGMRN